MAEMTEDFAAEINGYYHHFMSLYPKPEEYKSPIVDELLKETSKDERANFYAVCSCLAEFVENDANRAWHPEYRPLLDRSRQALVNAGYPLKDK